MAESFEFRGSPWGLTIHIIYVLQKMLGSGCQGFFAHVVDLSQEDIQQALDIPIVSIFPHVFPEELSGSPPDREIDFVIELLLCSALVPKVSYYMVLAELKEPKIHL